MTAAHAAYAPSSAHRWMNCTASAHGIAALPEQESGDEAAAGTFAHAEIERLLGHLNGQILSGPLPQPDPDHPAAHGIALTLDYLSQLPPGRVYVEQRVRLTDEIWGRCDIAHWHGESATLTIVDFKNGFVDVQAEENEQLRIYGGATIRTHDLPAQWVRYVVVQPNSFMPVPRVKQWMESADANRAFCERAAAIPHGPLTFAAGEQCKYCPLFGRCPASQDVLARVGVAMAHAPEAVPLAQVALFKAMEKPITDWFKGLDKAATKQALAGQVPDGMKLVQTSKHRAWKNETEARAVVVAKLGEAALDLCTPAQAEKLGMAKAEVGTLTETPPGGPALAFLSDKRPAFERKSLVAMFAA